MDFVGIFAILNPLGAIPVYLSMTANKSELEVKSIAIKTTIAVTIIQVISILAYFTFWSIQSGLQAAFPVKIN